MYIHIQVFNMNNTNTVNMLIIASTFATSSTLWWPWYREHGNKAPNLFILPFAQRHMHISERGELSR